MIKAYVLSRNAGNVEGTENSCPYISQTGNTNNLHMDTDNIVDQHSPQEYSPSHQDYSEMHTDVQSWENENLAIRKRHKPPKALKSGKFTRLNLTVGSLNIAGHEANISMHHRNHKCKFLKETIDINNLGILGI
jgi:hypothetical protein